MIFVHRAGDIEGGADLVQREMGGGGIAGHVGAQRIQLVDIGRQRIERGLRRIPFAHQFGIALGGADLQAGGDPRLGFLVGAGGRRAIVAQIGQALGIGGELGFQARNLALRRVWMVLLTWVPVSLPGSMETGVMVATGAMPPPAMGGGFSGGCRHCRPHRSADRRCGIGGGNVAVAVVEHIVEVGAGGQAQARRQHACQKKARFKAPFGWNSPHSALRCRRPCPRKGGGTHSTPTRLANARQPRRGSLVLTRPKRTDKGMGARFRHFTQSS